MPLSFPRRSSRRGVVSFLLLVVVAVMLAAGWYWFLQVRTRTAQDELRGASDSGALAAVRRLVDEAMLTKDPAKIFAVVDEARLHAAGFAVNNRPYDMPTYVFMEQVNPPDDDIVVGVILDPSTGEFGVPATGQNGGTPGWVMYNAARVRVRQLNQIDGPRSVSTAYIDRTVIGVIRRMTNGRTLLVPVALPSDVSATPAVGTFEEQRLLGNDNFTYTPTGVNKFVAGADGIAEVSFTIPAAPGAFPNAQPLDLRADTVNDNLNDQIPQGTTGPLNLTTAKSVNVNLWAGYVTTDLETQLNTLVTSGAARLWPLYRDPVGATTANVTDVIAARVVSVTNNAGTLTVTLQPTMLVSETVITRLFAGVPENPYVGRIRLVE